jgi:hypothetical protein
MYASPTSSCRKKTMQGCIKHNLPSQHDGGGIWIDPCNLLKGQPLREQGCGILAPIIIINTFEPCEKNWVLCIFFKKPSHNPLIGKSNYVNTKNLFSIAFHLKTFAHILTQTIIQTCVFVIFWSSFVGEVFSYSI